MFRGAIGTSKERCKRTRKRTVINRLTKACHQARKPPLGLDRGGPPPRASAFASTLKTQSAGPMRRRRRRGSPEPVDDRKNTASPVTGSGTHGREKKPGKNCLTLQPLSEMVQLRSVRKCVNCRRWRDRCDFARCSELNADDNPTARRNPTSSGKSAQQSDANLCRC